MIRFNRLGVFLVVFIVLLVMYCFLEMPGSRTNHEKPILAFPLFNQRQAAVIDITSPENGRIVLSENKGVWEAESDNRTFKADMELINRVFEKIGKMQAKTVVSTNPKKYDSLEVTKDKAVKVSITDASGKNIVRFFIGKSGPDIFSTYVRTTSPDRVVLVNGIMKTVFDRKISQWRDKSVININKNDIVEYKVDEGMSLDLKKNGQGKWEIVSPDHSVCEREKVNLLMRSFSQLKAVDFPQGPLKSFELDRPARTVTAVLKNGKKIVLLIGKEKNAFQTFVKIKNEPAIYLVENSEIHQLYAPAETLKQQIKSTDNSTKKIN